MLEQKRDSRDIPIGVLLLALGVVALLSQTGIFRGVGNLLGALIFGVAGYYLIRSHYRRPSHLWPLLVGFGLLGLGAAALLDRFSGSAFLGTTGIGFLVAYGENRERWWALIPGGVLITLGLVAGVDARSPIAGGFLFFVGLSAVFWYLYRHPRNPKSWAFYPAVALLALALLNLLGAGGWLFPLLLIAAGVYLIYRRQGQQLDGEGFGDALRGAVGSIEGALVGLERIVRELFGKESQGASANVGEAAEAGTENAGSEAPGLDPRATAAPGAPAAGDAAHAAQTAHVAGDAAPGGAEATDTGVGDVDDRDFRGERPEEDAGPARG